MIVLFSNVYNKFVSFSMSNDGQPIRLSSSSLTRQSRTDSNIAFVSILISLYSFFHFAMASSVIPNCLPYLFTEYVFSLFIYFSYIVCSERFLTAHYYYYILFISSQSYFESPSSQKYRLPRFPYYRIFC